MEFAGGRAVDPLRRLKLVSRPDLNALVMFLPSVYTVELGIRATARRWPYWSMFYKIPPSGWGEKKKDVKLVFVHEDPKGGALENSKMIDLLITISHGVGFCVMVRLLVSNVAMATGF